MVVLADLIKLSVEKYGDKVFLVDRGIYRRKEFTYNQLYAMAQGICGFFDKNDIAKGDKIVIYLPNGFDYVSLLWACALSGVVAVPIDFNSSAEFASKIGKIVDAKRIFCSVFKSPDSGKKIFVEELDKIYDKFKEFKTKKRIKGEDIFEIVYTSGTTSEPKGVVLKNKNLSANIHSAKEVIKNSVEGFSFLSILPLSHLFEQNVGLFIPMSFGAKIVYTSSKKSSSILEALNEERIRGVVSVPLFLSSIKEKIEKIAKKEGKLGDLNNGLKRFGNSPWFLRRFIFRKIRKKFRELELFVVGGAALDIEVEEFWRRLGIYVLQGYGLSETAPLLTCNSYEYNKPGTVGKAVSGVELKLENGEIIAKGENVFSGYYNDKMETNKVLKNGWFYTGDIGEFDSQGFLKITGRIKNMILSSSGLNIYPEDIEKVINGFPEVKDSVVIGLDSGKKLVGVILPNGKARDKDLLKKVNSKLNQSQYLNSIIVWKERDFPRTSTKKIKRRDVESGLVFKNADREASEDSLFSLISEVCDISGRKIKENYLLRDIGLDSLKRIELSVKIEEKFDVNFNEDEITDKTKVSDLRNLIKQNKEVKEESGINFFNKKGFVPLRMFLQWVNFVLSNVIYKVDIKGKENLNGLDGQFIIIANHSSMLDTLTILRVLPLRYRINLYVAAAKDFFYRPGSKYGRILGIFGRVVYNSFAFSRDKEIQQSLKDFGRIINSGGSVLIFPEGTRSITGKLSKFKPGIGLLAWNMDVQIVPIKMKGLYDILPKGRSLPSRGRVEVVIGKPIKFSKTQSFQDITDILYKKIEEM